MQGLAGFRIHRDERLVDLGLGRGRQLDLGFLGGFLEPLECHLVLRQIDPVLLFELGGKVVDDPHVEVFPTKEGVAVGGFDLEKPFGDLEDRDIEGTAAKVIDGDRPVLFLLKPVGERGRGGLVDDPQDLKPGDLAGVLGGLTLGVVEVGRNRDDRLVDLFAEIAFRRLLHLLKDERRYLAGRVLFALDLDPGVAISAINDGVGHHTLVLLDHRVVVPATDQAFDGKERVFGIGDSLTLGRLPDKTFVIRKTDNRWRGPSAFRVFDDLRLRPVHDGDTGVRGSKVDTNDFGHVRVPFYGNSDDGPVSAPPPLFRWRVSVFVSRRREMFVAVYMKGHAGLQAAQNRKKHLEIRHFPSAAPHLIDSLPVPNGVPSSAQVHGKWAECLPTF